MLTNIGLVKAVPRLGNNPLLTQPYLDALISAADCAIKQFLKWKVESTSFTEYYSGKNQQELILQQPWATSISSLWVDANGNWGQTQTGFGAGTLLTSGVNYALEIDANMEDGTPASQRSLVQMLGGGPLGTWPWPYWQGLNQGKLAGSPGPVWPLGRGNIKVTYTAGFTKVPPDLQYAATMLVVEMTRIQPSGTPLTSESLGAYSYSIAQQLAEGNYPELASIGPILRRYRETSF